MRVFHSDAYWNHGHFNVPWRNLGVNHLSNVVASITELSMPPGDTTVGFPFIGDAVMVIENIAPIDDGTVWFKINIVWDNNLPVRVTVFIDP